MGVGSPVIFLPGTGWIGREGLNIGELLCEHYQFYMVDFPGIGRSEGIQKRVTFRDMAEWVADYLDFRGLDQVHLIGHSLGGAMALAFALHYPERVRTLTILDMGHLPIPRFPAQMFGAIGYVMPFLSLAERLFGVDRLYKLLAGSDSKEESRETMEEKINKHKARGRYALADDRYLQEALQFEPDLSAAGLSLLFGLYRARIHKRLAAVQVPTLLVYGARPDAPAKRQQQIQSAVERLLQRNPNLTAYGVPAGHYVHWEHADVAPYVANFIQSKSAGQASEQVPYLFGLKRDGDSFPANDDNVSEE